MKTNFFYFFIFFSFTNIVISQSKNSEKIEIGERIKFYSKILNESRELVIYSPKTSTENKLTYPVIFVFDAESLFMPTVGAVQFLNYSSYLSQMPEAYIVGIVNTNRNRDMPVPQEIESTSGAENFLLFLSEELVPYMNKTFSANGLNILVGHSQGGLFVTYAAVKKPKLFPFIMALDAPMTVVKSVEELYSKKLIGNCSMKYVSLESLYGWRNNIKRGINCFNFLEIKVEGETHESMPFKSIYDGLKFLFNDYLPPVQDLPLKKIQEYYDSLAKKYQITYNIPASVLLESAKQNIAQSKKVIAIELIEANEKVFGQSSLSRKLWAKADTISKEPDERVSYNLSHPPPDENSIKPFLGKWSGTLIVPEGVNLDIDWEIIKVNDGYQMNQDTMKQFKSKSDFLYVNDKKELVWGRKHNGGGIYISIGKLSNDGLTITGTEDLVGFDFPKGMPPFKINTFEFRKL